MLSKHLSRPNAARQRKPLSTALSTSTKAIHNVTRCVISCLTNMVIQLILFPKRLTYMHEWLALKLNQPYNSILKLNITLPTTFLSILSPCLHPPHLFVQRDIRTPRTNQDPRLSRVVRIFNVPLITTPHELLEHFSATSPISVSLGKMDPGKEYTIAYMYFGTRKDRVAALGMHGTWLRSMYLDVEAVNQGFSCECAYFEVI